MIIENQEISNLSFNIISTNWTLKNCNITGKIEGNKGDSTIEFINCTFPNGIQIEGNECKIIIK